MRILRARERAAAPWSNGGGVTREIAAHPPGAGWDGFAWRVSLADVTRDGPYSPLPGVRRILTVVDGTGLELTVDGAVRLLPGGHRPFGFPGGAATGSRLLDGPVINLNVMLREGRADATVEIVRGTWAPGPSPSASPLASSPPSLSPSSGGGPDPVGGLLVVALEGGTRLTVPGETGEPGKFVVLRMERFDAMLWPGPDAPPGGLRADGTVAVIRLSGPPAPLT
ncbi:HutD/Ves family protein [Streptomyces kronopolitis]|uniref:HutD/Ves family protein n=1 Tax=Streptomyces kronopolitis TaxID=1612435 RepID=UPI0020C02DA2|nr:HutD family protein [Streptomyces kronopolitis]MCL6300269.1 HutD family protein [Streptomyces kronopolitis]